MRVLQLGTEARMMLHVLLCFAVLGKAYSQVAPSQYAYPTDGDIGSVNGSILLGSCKNVAVVGRTINCRSPTTSVLFDGIIPMLTGLDTDNWAAELFTLESVGLSTEMIFDFNGTPGYDGVGGVEVVMFNCPEWGIAVQHILLLQQEDDLRVNVGNISLLESSCSSLVTQLLCLLDINWVHIAELMFYASTDTCQSLSGTALVSNDSATNFPEDTSNAPEAAITEQSVTTSPTLCETCPSCPTQQCEVCPSCPEVCPSCPIECEVCPFCPTQCEVCPSCPTQCAAAMCPSCSTSTTLASVITAIATALLATVIFVLVQIAVCKCRPKFTSEKGTSAGGDYEDVDGSCDDSIPMSDYMYMNVGDTRITNGNTFQLRNNEAYGEGNVFAFTNNQAYATTR